MDEKSRDCCRNNEACLPGACRRAVPAPRRGACYHHLKQMAEPSSDAIGRAPVVPGAGAPGADPVLLPGPQAAQAAPPGVSVAGTALRRVAAAFGYRDFR